MTKRTVFIFPGQSRSDRLPGIATGAVPREFFYGYLALQDAGHDVAIADSRRDPDDILGRALVRLEIRRNAFINLGYSLQRVRALSTALDDSALALSFTDGFSLSLGLYGARLAPRPTLIGGFHGLADMVDFVRPVFRQVTHRRIVRAVAGLDHLFFFGEPDRQQSIERFAIPPEKTSLYRFGVDTEFWNPGDTTEQDMVLSVGSDPKRDYATLLATDGAAPLRLLTRLPVTIPPGRDIEVIHGSYHGSAVIDLVLRDMYRAAAVVAVPLLDVWQPTGYSVTLQAMACGRPVVLSDIKGLWDRDVYRHGINCMLVPPGDPALLSAAIERLRSDANLRKRVGAAARATAEQHFPLTRMNRDIVALVERFGTVAATTSPPLAATAS